MGTNESRVDLVFEGGGLIKSGRDAVTTFPETWKFQDRLAAFRASTEPAAPPPAVPA